LPIPIGNTGEIIAQMLRHSRRSQAGQRNDCVYRELTKSKPDNSAIMQPIAHNMTEAQIHRGLSHLSHLTLMIEVHFYHQSLQAIELPINVFSRRRRPFATGYSPASCGS
jgi:hypothetical protein